MQTAARPPFPGGMMPQQNGPNPGPGPHMGPAHFMQQQQQPGPAGYSSHQPQPGGMHYR